MATSGRVAEAAGGRGTAADARVAAESPRRSRATERRLGSKANGATYKTIINQIPPHRTYIEPYLGWGAIMLHKAPALHSICLDREIEKVEKVLLELATAHPTITAAIVDSADDNRWRAATMPRKDSSAVSAPTCDLLVGDAVSFLASYPWQGDEFVYCDPPYMPETRTSRHRYLFEMDALDHAALLQILRRIPSAVMISGYSSKLYSDQLDDWRVVTFEAITRGGTTRTEHLWCNFDEPLELHDYRFLGRNFRERQDLNRMRKRWTTKLELMSPLKRRALFAALREFCDRQPRHDHRAPRNTADMPIPSGT